ncbi:hypothetical protein AVEN_137247-1 [Araneus ventricosus]|uniref:Uncharacterized protein n=1 Tax=Araneus ventricosus TaxID=182803 RepID=A0A4Y2DS69_ARAVE|nr:hypothetical protein AVEN_137247-1 [Araneus ventricosus]
MYMGTGDADRSLHSKESRQGKYSSSNGRERGRDKGDRFPSDYPQSLFSRQFPTNLPTRFQKHQVEYFRQQSQRPDFSFKSKWSSTFHVITY